MIQSSQHVNFTVAQLGDLPRGEAENAVGVASSIQWTFTFDFYPVLTAFDFD